jgi:hypothetical protein
MTALVDAYASPSRNFDEATATELKSLLESKVGALVDLEALADRLDMTLGALAEDEPMMFTGGGGKNPYELVGEGYARIERICTGYGDPTPAIDKAANGYLQLTVGYTEKGIDSVIWGGATACEEQSGTTQLRINGQINLHIGNWLHVGDLPTLPVLFRLSDFAFHVDDVEEVSGGFDFQVCRGDVSNCKSGFVEMLLALPSGGSVVFFFDTATKDGGFRAANGIWTCAFLDGTCNDGQGNVVTTPVYSL